MALSNYLVLSYLQSRSEVTMSLLTLKFLLFFASLLGILKFNLPKRSPKLLQFSFLLYYNTLNVISVSLCILSSLQLPSAVSGYLIIKQSDFFIASILKIVSQCVFLLWYIVYLVVIVYFRINDHKIKLLCKFTRVCLKITKNNNNKEFGLLFFAIGFKITFISLILLMYTNYLLDGVFSTTMLLLVLFSCFGIVNFLDIYFCLQYYSKVWLFFNYFNNFRERGTSI